MIRSPLKLGLLAGAVLLAAGLGGCADDYYAGGVATGYYTGPVGYGAEYYAGYGYPAYGWYNDFYYPGYGIYVFDRYGHRRAWRDEEREHWAYRGNGWRGSHLYGDHGFDARRDRAYMADRNAAFRSYRGGGQPGGGEHRDGGHREGGDRHH